MVRSRVDIVGGILSYPTVILLLPKIEKAALRREFHQLFKVHPFFKPSLLASLLLES